ncbi:DUF423 domain-containing protein [Marinobacterium lutimaris]|uniref:Uncharacterized membrane protein YgdD, TMEM256/DUF423 family n=1 Tax=Marinobacterium lutimaris TaxID=568106 RepID=A0A1H6D111_9GAMM|nr:DUF423 domain-containing protein [Marinobacterium lutimaris]SEG78930.1 Uncharacterized membrane protein YgdD, TMEM256/DUF423 family [Marinobacterium lutimaris]
MSARLTFLSAALLGALAVCLGAFAAHGLRDQLTPRMLEVFQTGVTYQFYHVFALFGVGLLLQRQDRRLLRVSAVLFLVGMLLFCGSLYLLVATGVHYLGMVTPVGGVLMIAGWLTLAGGVFKALPGK